MYEGEGVAYPPPLPFPPPSQELGSSFALKKFVNVFHVFFLFKHCVSREIFFDYVSCTCSRVPYKRNTPNFACMNKASNNTSQGRQFKRDKQCSPAQLPSRTRGQGNWGRLNSTNVYLFHRSRLRFSEYMTRPEFRPLLRFDYFSHPNE